MVITCKNFNPPGAHSMDYVAPQSLLQGKRAKLRSQKSQLFRLKKKNLMVRGLAGVYLTRFWGQFEKIKKKCNPSL